MDQLHKRFADEQVKLLLQRYGQGLLARSEVQEILSISKSWFFSLLREYRHDPEAFSVSYKRHTPGRLSPAVEAEIERALLQEKAIVDDRRLPISGYNYSALRDRLAKRAIQVSVTTIINRAKRLDCYKPRKKRRVHDREVLTASIGALIQHDASTHLWSPFAQDKWAPRSWWRLMASLCATTSTSCVSFASSREEIVSGASMSSRLTMSMPSGER